MIIVDTHAVIWVTQEPSQLSARASAVLIHGRREGELAIADITLREIADQISRQRIRVSLPLDVYLRFVESVFLVLAVNGAIAERSVRFGSNYPKDPADRLIGATAIVHGAQLVTADGKIRRSGEVDCVW